MTYFALIITRDKRVYTVSTKGLLTQETQYTAIFSHWMIAKKAVSKWSKIYHTYIINDLGVVKRI